MKLRSIVFSLFAAGVGLLGQLNAAMPLSPGERLRYSVSWAIVPGAGEITVSSDQAAQGQMKVTTKTSTRGIARLILPFDATAEALYEPETGRLVSLHDRSSTRGKHVEHIITLDYADHSATYVVVGSATPQHIEIPEGAPSDLISALLSTREWDIKPGDARDAVVLFGDEFYLLTIHAARYEDIETDLGSFRTLVLEPRMEKTPPKGMFKKGSSVRVWISQDERRLPVRFEVEFNIGTGVATLDKYSPPTPVEADKRRPPVKTGGVSNGAATHDANEAIAVSSVKAPTTTVAPAQN